MVAVYHFDSTEVPSSALFKLVGPGNRVWHCSNHVCKSPIMQMSADQHMVCNGCLRAQQFGDLSQVVLQPLDGPDTVLSCTDTAREVDTDERG